MTMERIGLNVIMKALGQLYAVNVDYQENYNVYGGMQDNGVWFGKIITHM